MWNYSMPSLGGGVTLSLATSSGVKFNNSRNEGSLKCTVPDVCGEQRINARQSRGICGFSGTHGVSVGHTVTEHHAVPGTSHNVQVHYHSLNPHNPPQSPLPGERRRPARAPSFKAVGYMAGRGVCVLSIIHPVIWFE